MWPFKPKTRTYLVSYCSQAVVNSPNYGFGSATVEMKGTVSGPKEIDEISAHLRRKLGADALAILNIQRFPI